MKNELIRYCLDMAVERLNVAELMFNKGNYKDSIICSYFALFNAMRALLAEDKTFLAVVRNFRRRYIQTGSLDKKFSVYFDTAFKLRKACDYGDFVIVSREEAEEQYQHAVEFVAAVKNYLEGVQ